MSTKILTAKDILGFDDMRRERVEVPEWGGAVFIKTMTGDDRDAFDQDQYNAMKAAREAGGPEANLPNIRARMVACCACDSDGKLLFTMDQVEALGRKSGAALDRLWSVARRLNRLSDDDVKELAGN